MQLGLLIVATRADALTLVNAMRAERELIAESAALPISVNQHLVRKVDCR